MKHLWRYIDMQIMQPPIRKCIGLLVVVNLGTGGHK